MEGRIVVKASDPETIHAQTAAVGNGDPLALEEIGKGLMRLKYFDWGWGADIMLGMAYLAGVVEGKRQERQRRFTNGYRRV